MPDDWLSRIDDMDLPKPKGMVGRWNYEAMKKLGLVKHTVIINGKEFEVLEYIELAEVDP
jgi:hypothetical protein